jgi:hypothetical protein
MEVAQQILKDISSKIAYIQLCACVMPAQKGNASFSFSNEISKIFNDFIKTATKDEIITKGPAVLNLIEPLLQMALKLFPPRKRLEVIAMEFKKFQIENPDYPTYGIIYGWLNDLIDCTRLYSDGLPSHARVGAFLHAGKFAVDENMILRDAFFFLALAEREMESFNQFITFSKIGKNGLDDDSYSKAMNMNTNIGSFCRTSLVNFYSFVEAFVNGIGLDHLFKNSQKLESKDQEMLRGKYKGSYISLEKRLEQYSQIIRPDRKRVLIVTDLSQRKEPYKTFFDEGKEIRDSAVHFSALKEPIVRKPDEWLRKVKQYSKVSLNVAKDFWEASYQTKKYPDYMDLLDYDILYKIALKRLSVTYEINNETISS